MKCQSCREKDAELFTRWEKIRNWFFTRASHIFFPQDFDDLKTDIYTQGFSDGYVEGTEKERKFQERINKRYG